MKRKNPGPRLPRTKKEAEKLVKSVEKQQKRMGLEMATQLKKIHFKDGRILDAGCGGGEMTYQLAQILPKAEVVGLDEPGPLLEIAEEVARDVPNLSIEKGDIQNMPFKDNWFDVVVSMNVFHAISDPVAMLNEIERVLKPGGVCGLGDRKRSWAGYMIPALKTAYTAQEAKEILAISRLRPWKFNETTFWFSVTAGEYQSKPRNNAR
ncbi:MAG: class I SAM-dependent methyltransferase [Theionarchaea archaeon]|nr:class I SAM-dependent methyltransferase [Theionarchaea archaeon]MBU7038908.1 class I SAM-dependent methyltransferase [Theionarchaea archaeon]